MKKLTLLFLLVPFALFAQWEDVTPPDSNIYFRTLKAMDAEKAFAFGLSDLPYNNVGVVYKTVNGGLSWDSTNVYYYNSNSNGPFLTSVSFLNDTTFVLGGTDGRITFSDGETYNTIQTGTWNDSWDVHYLNDTTILRASGWLQISYDLGQTWEFPLGGGVDNNRATEIIWNDEVKGLLSHLDGATSKIKFSIDDGLSWDSVIMMHYFQEIQYYNDYFYLVGNDGVFAKLSVDGTSYSINILSENHLTDIAIINDDTWYVSGGYYIPYTGQIVDSLGFVLKTTDGGNSWDITEFPQTITALDMLDEDVGYAVTFHGKIYKITNEGMSFVDVEESVECEIYPNPFTKELQVNFPSVGEWTIEWYSISGEKIKEDFCTDSPCQLNSFDLKKGLYILRVSQNGKEFYQKLIKL